MQEHADWHYDKTEELSAEQLQQFSHLVVGGSSKYSLDLKPFLDTHHFVAEIESFSAIKFNYTQFPPISIETKPSIFILKKTQS